MKWIHEKFLTLNDLKDCLNKLSEKSTSYSKILIDSHSEWEFILIYPVYEE